MTHVLIQPEPLRVEELMGTLRADGDGAVSVFVGTVRDHNRGRRVLGLAYEAWDRMARREMEKLAHEAEERFAISGAVLAHRVGDVAIGEASIVIVVAAPHRGPALDACRYLIDSFKERVPIWKKERFEGGEVWIEGAGETPRRSQS